MARSAKVRTEFIPTVKDALIRNGFFRQIDLAERLELSQSTIHSFLNGKPVDYLNFLEICKILGFEILDIADLEQPTKVSEAKTITPNPSSLSSLELPEGEVPLNSPFYIERPPIEQRCCEEICKPGSLIRIKAPQQTGKSSLLARILKHTENQGDRTVILDFKLAESEYFSDLNRFLRWFCCNLILELTQDNQQLQQKLVDKLDEHWKLAQRIGSMKTCKDYLERFVLPELSHPLTLALEEADRIFEYPKIYKDFFGLLRSLHEEAKRRDIWKQLRLVIVHSTEAYVPMDINQSPFNIGLSVELPEFTHAQVKNLANRYQLNWSDTEVDNLMAMIGGHPFFTRLALYKVANQEITLTQLLKTAPTAEGIFNNSLRMIESILKQQPDLGIAMKALVNSTATVFTNEVRYKLRALGLVKLQGDEITLSCELHRQYFQNF